MSDRQKLTKADTVALWHAVQWMALCLQQSAGLMPSEVMSQSFVKRPDNGPHSALSGLGVLANDKITIRYEGAGRCFWHIACTAQRHAPPMRIGEDDAEKRRTVIRCVACNEAGYYPHGSVGDVCCERVPAGVTVTGHQVIDGHTPMKQQEKR